MARPPLHCLPGPFRGRRGPVSAVARSIAAIAVAVAASPAQGQTTRPIPATGPAELSFNFPDAVDLRTLADYVSRRLGINIIYDAELAKPENAVTIRSPGGLPVDALLPMFRSVLRMKGYDLVPAGAAGWLRVAKADAAAADAGQPVVQFVTLKYADASRVAQQVKQLLLNSRPAIGATTANATAGATPDTPAPFEIVYDERTSQVGAMGPAAIVAQAAAIIAAIDVPVPHEGEPIRFYKLTNATAADVLDTIRELHGLPRSGPARDPAGARSPAPTAEAAYANGGSANGIRSNANGGTLTAPYMAGSPGGTGVGNVASPDASDRTARGNASADASADRPANGATVPGVTADPNTNTIIVMGGPELQQRYGQLIKELDKRRPQVLLEATIVTLDTSNRFSVGVEIGGRSAGDGKRVITFSQFGLSDVDRDTGRLRISPGTGFNGALVGSDVADVVVQALAANDRARVQSAPRVLVNDNATGTLSSVAEQPFTSVNASNTVSTTSFGGYAEAGTTVTLTPHISEGDYLQLEYSVELSSFNGSADPKSGSPPPRQTNKVESRVTIPDGSTIIVGGLNRTNLRRAKQAIPILGQIPILEYLFSQRDEDDSTSTLFVFLRPIILRDDQFQDLKNLSEGDIKRAGLPGDFPASGPVLIRG